MSRCRLSFLIAFAVLPGAAAAQPADAGAADKARAFERFCETGGCAPEGLSQSEFVARFEGSRYPALEFSGREIERFREKFLGHQKFTLEINLRLARPDAGALSVAGRFVSWFDDDVTSLREESYAKSCRITSRTPLVCKITDGQIVIWFDRETALHFIELTYDAGSKSYRTRRHRIFQRKAG